MNHAEWSDLKIINAHSEGLKKKKILIGMKSLLDNWQMVRDGAVWLFFQRWSSWHWKSESHSRTRLPNVALSKRTPSPFSEEASIRSLQSWGIEVIIYTSDLIKQWLFNKIIKQESYIYTFPIRDNPPIISRLSFTDLSGRDLLRGAIPWLFKTLLLLSQWKMYLEQVQMQENLLSMPDTPHCQDQHRHRSHLPTLEHLGIVSLGTFIWWLRIRYCVLILIPNKAYTCW